MPLAPRTPRAGRPRRSRGATKTIAGSPARPPTCAFNGERSRACERGRARPSDSVRHPMKDRMSSSLLPCPKGCARSQPQAGFTLIEVMITVVIVAILASVAYPSYIEYVARGHRTQLKAQMQAAQQWMERRYSERYVYDDAAIPANAAN